MEFIAEIADRKTIQKLDIGINQFLIENNVSQIEKILNFHNCIRHIRGGESTKKKFQKL